MHSHANSPPGSQLWRPNEGCTSLRSAELCSKVLQILKIFFVRLYRGTQVHRRLMQLWRHSPSIKVLSRGSFRTQHRCGMTCSSLIFSDNFFFRLLKLCHNETTTAQKKDHFPYPCSILFAFKIFASWLRCLRLTVISSVWLGSSIRIWASAYIKDTWIQERKSWYREKQAFNPRNEKN